MLIKLSTSSTLIFLCSSQHNVDCVKRSSFLACNAIDDAETSVYTPTRLTLFASILLNTIDYCQLQNFKSSKKLLANRTFNCIMILILAISVMVVWKEDWE